MRRVLLSTLALVATLAVNTAKADINGFDFNFEAPMHVRTIGQTLLSDLPDSDVINVSRCAAGSAVTATALRVVVRQDPARIDAIVVTFGNGQHEQLDIRKIFARDSESRWVDLNGGTRCIERIRIIGEAIGPAFPKQSLIRIQAITGAGSIGTIDPNFAVNKIGETLLSDAKDSDLVRVSSCTGGDHVGANAIKLLVSRDPARIDRLVVAYGNGERERLEVREVFPQNSQSRWIDLNGGVRCIRAIKIEGEAIGPAWGRQSLITFLGLRSAR